MMKIQNLKLNIAKLVFGYLMENNFINTAQTFVNECNVLHENPNLINEILTKKSDDNLQNIVEDYFDSKKFAFVQSCDMMNSRFVKLKDILENLLPNIDKNAVDIHSAPKRGRKKRKGESNNYVNPNENNATGNPYFTHFNPTIAIEGLTAMAPYMAHEINTHRQIKDPLATAQQALSGDYFSTDIGRENPAQPHTSSSTSVSPWVVDLDNRNTVLTEDNNNSKNNHQTHNQSTGSEESWLKDIILESMESVFTVPVSSTLESYNSQYVNLRRHDSLHTPDKEHFNLLELTQAPPPSKNIVDLWNSIENENSVLSVSNSTSDSSSAHTSNYVPNSNNGINIGEDLSLTESQQKFRRVMNSRKNSCSSGSNGSNNNRSSQSQLSPTTTKRSVLTMSNSEKTRILQNINLNNFFQNRDNLR